MGTVLTISTTAATTASSRLVGEDSWHLGSERIGWTGKVGLLAPGINISVESGRQGLVCSVGVMGMR